MNEEIRNNEINEEELEEVSGGAARTIPTVPVYSHEQIAEFLGKHEDE